jgi:hypothetical protein
MERRLRRKIKKEGMLAILNFRGFFHFFGSDNIPVPRAETGGFRQSNENISLFCRRADKLPL